MDLSRASLRRAYEAFASAERRSGGRDGELELPDFLALIETLDADALAVLRAKLPSLVGAPDAAGDGAPAPARGERSGMLVFDDGKQQIWRLVPGGRSLVKKAKRGADGAWGSAFGVMVS